MTVISTKNNDDHGLRLEVLEPFDVITPTFTK